MKLVAKHCTVAKQHDVKQPSRAGSRLGLYLKMFSMGQSICVPDFMLLTQSARLSQNPALAATGGAHMTSYSRKHRGLHEALGE